MKCSVNTLFKSAFWWLRGWPVLKDEGKLWEGVNILGLDIGIYLSSCFIGYLTLNNNV